MISHPTQIPSSHLTHQAPKAHVERTSPHHSPTTHHPKTCPPTHHTYITTTFPKKPHPSPTFKSPSNPQPAPAFCAPQSAQNALLLHPYPKRLWLLHNSSLRPRRLHRSNRPPGIASTQRHTCPYQHPSVHFSHFPSYPNKQKNKTKIKTNKYPLRKTESKAVPTTTAAKKKNTPSSSSRLTPISRRCLRGTPNSSSSTSPPIGPLLQGGMLQTPPLSGIVSLRTPAQIIYRTLGRLR